MHVGVRRRVPAERARHAKRLGHAQPGSGPTFSILANAGNGISIATIPIPVTQQGLATTSSQTPSTPATTSTIHSLSSALTSSPTPPSASSALSPSTTPSTSSVVSSTGIQPLTGSALSSSPATSPAVPTSTFSTSSSTSTPQPNVAAATHSGLSGGAIAGIIAGAAIVGTALIVFFIRKTYLRRRERQDISWSGAPGLGAGIHDESKPFPDIGERRASFTSVANTSQKTVPLSPFVPHSQSMYSTPVTVPAHMQPPTIPAYAVPAPPPTTYNNPVPVAAYPTQPLPFGPGNPPLTHVATSTGIPSTLSSAHAPVEATVKCTFVPTLPDELSITTGERIFIVEQYDDGWDLCANTRGERGMVPRECLEQVPVDQPDMGWRSAGRTSSLNLDGRRY